GPYRLGGEITHAGVIDVAPPREVRGAFDEVTRAASAIEQQINQARQEANDRQQAALSEKVRLERETNSYAQTQRAMAKAEAEDFLKGLDQYRRLGKDNRYYLNALWWDEMSRLYARLRDNGRIDLLDNHLGADGLDITQVPLLPRSKK